MDKREKTINELKKYYRFKYINIPNLKNRIELINYEVQGVGAIEYTDMPGPTGCKKTSYRNEKLLDEKNKLLKSLEYKNKFVSYIDAALNKLPELDKNLLIECYAKDKIYKSTEECICEKLAISISTIKRNKKKILENFIKDLY